MIEHRIAPGDMFCDCCPDVIPEDTVYVSLLFGTLDHVRKRRSLCLRCAQRFGLYNDLDAKIAQVAARKGGM